jgi:hypothetical protein
MFGKVKAISESEDFTGRWCGAIMAYVCSKMVDSTGSEAECSSCITRIVTEQNEVSCKCCDDLKHELTKTLSELKTALEIIKILQEDDNTMCTIERMYMNQNQTRRSF